MILLSKRLQDEGYPAYYVVMDRDMLLPNAQGEVKVSLNDGITLFIKTLHQVHSDRVVFIEKGNSTEGDALVSTTGLPVGIKTADCVPVLGCVPGKGVTFAIHAGWRGLEKRIVSKTINSVVKHTGCMPGDIFTLIGPHICNKHYEVGPELISRFATLYGNHVFNDVYLDLRQCTVEDLRNAGVPIENIEISGICNYEVGDLPSYRRDGKNSSRILSFIFRV